MSDWRDSIKHWNIGAWKEAQPIVNVECRLGIPLKPPMPISWAGLFVETDFLRAHPMDYAPIHRTMPDGSVYDTPLYRKRRPGEVS